MVPFTLSHYLNFLDTSTVVDCFFWGDWGGWEGGRQNKAVKVKDCLMRPEIVIGKLL
jgi:hypothetical protein